jgi:hypothetical protein
LGIDGVLMIAGSMEAPHGRCMMVIPLAHSSGGVAMLDGLIDGAIKNLAAGLFRARTGDAV